MSEKRNPQRLYRTVDVCDSCGARDSFRATGRRGNVTYLKCAACGRRATRLILWQDRPAAENQKKGKTDENNNGSGGR